MIALPVSPAPAGLPQEPAGAPPVPGVDVTASALSNGAQFIELLKQLTASANAQAIADTGVRAGAPVSKADLDAAIAALPVRQTPKPASQTAVTPVPAPPEPADDAALTAPPIVVVPATAPDVPPPAQSVPPVPGATPPRATPTLTLAALPAPNKTGCDDAPANLPVTQVADTTAPAAPKFAVAADPQQAGAASDGAVPVASGAAPDVPVAPVSAAHAQPAPQADDVHRSGAAKANAAAANASATPISVAPAARGTTGDASAQKRDASADAGGRRSLDAIVPRGPAPAPGSVPAFQMTADLRPFLANGTGVMTMSSPAFPGSGVSVHDAADLPQQMVQAMKLQWNNGVGDARIRLTPEYLGELTISIRVDRGDVTATLQASAPEVRQWIEGHESMLRQMLADRGLQLDEFVVTDEPPSDSGDEDAQRRDTRDEQPQGRRREASGATFEVVV